MYKNHSKPLYAEYKDKTGFKGKWHRMNWKRALLFLILLLVIAFRHLSFSTNETRIDDLEPILSILFEIDIALEDTIKRLEDFEMAASPDQDYLIIMAKDNTSLIKLICAYNAQLLSQLKTGSIKDSYLQTYIHGVRNNLEYEKVRLQNNLDRIDSVYPVIKDLAVQETIDEAKASAQSILALFDKSIKILETSR